MHYELQELLGIGANGRVFRARDVRLNRTVAVKLLRVGDLEDPAGLERFRAEARNLASLQHPNIVALHDVGEHDGAPYLVTDYIEGRTLEDAMPGMSGEALIDILAKIAGALQHAHVRGVLHRDVKPANVIIDRSGEPHLVDFGLSHASNDPSLTASCHAIGTPQYMSPEQVSSDYGPMSPRTDVYALGVILYRVLTGVVPFCSFGVSDVFVQILRGDPLRPRRRDRSIDPDLEAVCLKAMERRPEDRYATADELASDLRRWRAGEPVRARRVTTIGTAIRRVSRHRRELAVFALGAAAATAVMWVARFL